MKEDIEKSAGREYGGPGEGRTNNVRKSKT